MAPDVDEDLDDEEEKPPPPRLAAAAEEMLALATKAGVRRRDESIPDRLLEVLRLVGRLHELCLTEAGFFAPDPPPTNDDEIAWAAEREMAFLRRCADELAELAARCVRFSVALWVDLRPDWQEEAADARREVVGEAREELLSELGILGERSGRGRRPTSSKHDVAEFLRPTLLFAALTCADASHEVAHPSFPGTAGSTMLGLAASLLTDGDEIATAGDYGSWPELGDDDW